MILYRCGVVQLRAWTTDTELNKNTIELGQDISVTNLATGSEIVAFQVKIIRYGRMVKMCWIGETTAINEGTYLTVAGCKQK